MNLERPIATGNTASIYLHDGKIIKMFNDFLPDTEAEYEANKQKHAYLCGLPVPYIHEATKINGRQAIIMEYIEGRTIGQMMYDDMSKAEEYMSLSVDIQQKIHATEASGLELMSDKLNRQILSASPLNNSQKHRLIEQLSAMRYDKKLCHGDYHVFNLIYQDGNVSIIDWVDSSAGDIRADVYRTYLLYTQFSMELADMYLQLYCNKSGLLKDEILIWEPIIAGARLSESVSSERESQLVEIVNQYCPV